MQQDKCHQDEEFTHRVERNIGRRLKQIRRLRGLTQMELGGKIGVHGVQIQRYEKGHHQILSSRLFDLARALKVDMNFFFEGCVDNLGWSQIPATETHDILTED